MNQIEKWIKSIKTGYDRLIKTELSRFNIDEECGLDRVDVRYAGNDSLDCYQEDHKISDWYIDGALAFSIYKKCELRNEGLDIKKTGNDSFVVTQNGKASPFEITMTETYYVVRKEGAV